MWTFSIVGCATCVMSAPEGTGTQPRTNTVIWPYQAGISAGAIADVGCEEGCAAAAAVNSRRKATIRMNVPPSGTMPALGAFVKGTSQRRNHRRVENLAHLGAERGDLDGFLQADQHRSYHGDAAQLLQQLRRDRRGMDRRHDENVRGIRQPREGVERHPL